MKRLIRTLLSALLLATAATFVAPNSALAAEQSSVVANDATVRSGCNFIPVAYAVSGNYDPDWGYDDWTLEVNINGPDGYTGGEYLSGILDDPDTGVFNAQICDYEGDSVGTYNITWSFETPGLTETGNKTFRIKARPKPRAKPTAKLSLAGTTIRKASGNRAVIKVKSTAKVSGKAIRGRKLAFYLPNDGLEWNRRGSTKATNSKGVARKKVVWRWGQLDMPRTIPLRVCLSGTGSYSGSCVVKYFKVKR